MLPDARKLDLSAEAAALAKDMAAGDPRASVRLARLIEADSRLAFQLFARVLGAKLRAHLYRWAELGVTDPEVTVDDALYGLMQAASSELLSEHPENGSGGSG